MDYNCYDIPEPMHKNLSLFKKKLEKPKPLSPFAWFNTTVSSKEIEKSLKECVPVGTLKVPIGWSVHFSNSLCRETSIFHRKHSLRIYSRKNILQRIFLIVYIVLFLRPGESMGLNTPVVLFAKCFVDYYGIQRIAS